MESSEALHARHDPPSRCGPALTVPPGWLSMRSDWFRSTDGKVEMTHVERSGTVSRGVADMARRHHAEITAQGGVSLHATTDATALTGRSVTVQTFTIPLNGPGRIRLCAAYHVADDTETAVIVTASGDSEAAAAVTEHLLREYDPWAPRSGGGQPKWVDVDDAAAGRATILETFTSNELLAVANLFGVTALPGIVEGADPDVDLTLAGLVDRGIVGMDEAGNATVGPALEQAMRNLVAPTMVVSIECGPRDGTRRTVLHVGATSLVSVRQLDNDAFRVASDSADQLDTHLMQHLDLRDVEAVACEPVLVDSSAFEGVRAGDFSGDVATTAVALARRVVRVRVLVALPGGAVGDELTCVDGGIHGYWLVAQVDDVTPQPVFSCRPIGASELISAIMDMTMTPPIGNAGSDR